MKTWKKVLLIISGIALVMGICCVIIGFSLGVNFKEIKSIVTDGHYNFVSWDWDWDEWPRWGNSRGDHDDDLSDKEDSFSGIKNLEIDVRYSKVVLEENNGSDIKVSANNINISKFSAKSDGRTLKIEDKTKRMVGSSEIIISIPKGTDFDEVSMEVDAGEVLIDALNAREFSAEIGGGRLSVSGVLSATEIDCSVGAGQIEVQKLSGSDIELECGAGQVKVVLDGSQEDYYLEGKCVGEIKFGTESYGSIGKKISEGTGSKNINVECGVGQINIQFAK